MQNQSDAKKICRVQKTDKSCLPIERPFGENITAVSQERESVDAVYLIRLPEIRFHPELIPRPKLAEMAKIFYSGAADKRQKAAKIKGPEAISSILPRVMAEIVKVKQERTN